MKFIYWLLLSLLIFPSILQAQISYGGIPLSFTKSNVDKPSQLDLGSVNLKALEKEDAIRSSKDDLVRIGIRRDVEITTSTHGKWIKINEGYLWRLIIHSAGAKSIGLSYSKFSLNKGSSLFIYSENKEQIIGSFDYRSNPKRKEFATEKINSNKIVIEFFSSDISFEEFRISGVTHFYKSPMDIRDFTKGFGTSQNCEVNINCSEGDNWQDQKRGVAGIELVIGNNSYVCSGSLINNLKQDQKAFFLSAYHCGQGASAADYNQWIFKFNYEASGCNNPNSEPASNTIVGCTMRSNSNDNGGDSGSDFLLLELNSQVPLSYNPYYNGWDRSNVASPSGVSIHHPDGDIKKISTYSSSLVSTSWAGAVPDTHWEVVWVQTQNNHGVTEGGSSGSPIFNSAGLIIGVLTGGTADCNNLNDSDEYGKFSYSWSSNGNTSATRLSDWLDPEGSGITILQGFDPNQLTTDDCNYTSGNIGGNISDENFITKQAIESDASVVSGNVKFRSNTEIELKNLFQVNEGSEFIAEIGDCIEGN